MGSSAASALAAAMSLGDIAAGEVHGQIRQILPEEVAAVDDLAAAHVEEVHRQHVVFEVEAEDVGVLVVGGGDALLVLHLVDGDDLVAEAGGELELLVFGGLGHAFGEALLELARAAFEKELHVADGLLVDLGGGQVLRRRGRGSA